MEAAYAHSENSAGQWHLLADHLKNVGRLAKQFAGKASWSNEAALAGLLHDLGKYGARFQDRLHGMDSGLDHWSQGAWIALTETHSVAAALAIQGHHVGLQGASVESMRAIDPKRLIQSHPFRLELSDPDPLLLKHLAEMDGLVFETPERKALPLKDGMRYPVAAMLDVRLLFSCLSDADFADTEAHFEGDANGKRYRPKGSDLDTAAALAALDSYMLNIRNKNQTDGRVRLAREMLWQNAIKASQSETGVFTFTAPTGSGKTLAMLKFALEHASRHKLSRIVVVMPFLSIIDQTARVYRSVFMDFPDNFVLEHHSLAGLGEESARGDSENATDRQRRLLSQNWDAPIVLTTNVQFLESLFSNRPSTCRKLHNLMESVILLDEAQSLPQQLAIPTLAAFSHLSSVYRSTVVFATATQPAFDVLDNAVKKHAIGGWRPVEAVSEHPKLFESLRRVSVSWPKPGETRKLSELADELRRKNQVMCVVNLKRHARSLLDALTGTDSIFHLSTNLCAKHRRAILNEVRTRLKHGEACRLISTQCVEAGVDVDFPLVYRALAPMEAIAQAAGRCNREGGLAGLGEVVVFEPEELKNDWRQRYPTHSYYQATEVTRKMLLDKGGNLDIDDPDSFKEYYRKLYDLSRLDASNKDLNEAIQALDFVEVAKLYRIIDQDTIQVLVPFPKYRKEFDELQSEANRAGISGNWIRRAQSLAVSIYRPRERHPSWGVLIPTKFRHGGASDEWFILEDPHGEYYDQTIGLKLPESDQVFIA